MRKRSFPWSEGNGPQLKYHVSEKEVTNRSSEAMAAVYNKTLTKLFNGAKNASNNNLQQQSASILEDLQQLSKNRQQRPTFTGKEATHINELTIEVNPIKLQSTQLNSLSTTTSSEPRETSIFQIAFANAQKTSQATPVCVSCVRFSSTAAALNPSIVASSQPCSSCSGLTCQICLNPCRGCSTLVCGNCSIDVESVSGYKAEMFIVCLGCRDRFDTESSGYTMDMS